MALIMREYATRWRKDPAVEHDSASAVGSSQAGLGDRKQRLLEPNHETARASITRCDCSPDPNDWDPEHPLRSPHPTD